MIKIAVIDDELTSYLIISKLINKWSTQENVTIETDHYLNFDESFPNDDYDAIFLGIQFKDYTINGLDIARTLRDKNFKGSIIFITNYQEYVYEGYEVSALAYLLKPVDYDKLSKCLKKIQSLCQHQYIYIKSKGNTYKYSMNDILYIESDLHYITIYCINSTLKIKRTLSSIFSELTSSFQYCFRSIIVNCSQIQCISTKNSELTLSNGIVLPISKTFMPNIQKAFTSDIIW